MKPGMTIEEISSEQNRSEGMRSFSITHATRDTRRSVILTCHGVENISHWSDSAAGADPQFVGDSETLIKNAELAHLLSAFTTHLLTLMNITQLGSGPIHLGC